MGKIVELDKETRRVKNALKVLVWNRLEGIPKRSYKSENEQIIDLLELADYIKAYAASKDSLGHIMNLKLEQSEEVESIQ